MHQRFGRFSSPSICLKCILQAGDCVRGIGVHRTADDLSDLHEAKSVVEKRFDGDLIRGIHNSRHRASHPKRFIPQVETRKSVMVGLTEVQLSDLGEVQ